MTKSKSVSTIIKKTQNVEKARTIFPKETDSGPDYMSSAMGSFGNGAQGFTIGKKYKDERREGPGPGEYDTDASMNITRESIKGKTYIAADNDFEYKNSFQNASLERKSKSRYSNSYLYQNMSPNSKTKVVETSYDQSAGNIAGSRTKVVNTSYYDQSAGQVQGSATKVVNTS